MCLSLAGRISRIDGEHALVDMGGRHRHVSLALLLLEGERVAPGDWVLVHTGLAVSRLEPAEGDELARLRRAMETTEQGESP